MTLLRGWRNGLATGFTWAGAERLGARASLLAFGGPNPLGGFSARLDPAVRRAG